ncbi:alpha/beta hydrolase [Vibrio sp.]|nr:alpha/beta hydrolase [Vibrio sp.]
MSTFDNIQLSKVSLNNGIEMEYAKTGTGKYPILFIHGYGDSWYSFSAVMNYMANTEYTMISVSLRGHGESSKPLNDYKISDYINDIIQFLDIVEFKPLAVVGHSMGTFIARELSLQISGVEKLILVDSAASADTDTLREVQEIVKDLKDPVPSKFAYDFQSGTCIAPLVEGIDIETIVEESSKLPAHVWKIALDELIAHIPRDSDFDELAKITIPTLILWGKHDDIFPKDQQDILLEKIKSSKIRIFEDAGHAPNWEFPSKVAKEIDLFIKD